MNGKIAFIGCGNMAEALIRGIDASGHFHSSSLGAMDVRPVRLKALAKAVGICVYKTAPEAVKGAMAVILSVKPQQMAEAVDSIAESVLPGQLVISIAAGVPISFFESRFKKGVAVVRAMPNTPALVRSGVTVLAKGRWAKDEQLQLAKRLFQTVGIVETMPEARMDAVTALSGSGPAYVFYLTEALAEAGLRAGLPKGAVESLARETVIGAAKLMQESPGVSAEALRERVTSPGGTTEAAVKTLEKRRSRAVWTEAVKAASARSKELSKRFV